MKNKWDANCYLKHLWIMEKWKGFGCEVGGNQEHVDVWEMYKAREYSKKEIKVSGIKRQKYPSHCFLMFNYQYYNDIILKKLLEKFGRQSSMFTLKIFAVVYVQMIITQKIIGHIHITKENSLALPIIPNYKITFTNTGINLCQRY